MRRYGTASEKLRITEILPKVYPVLLTSLLRIIFQITPKCSRVSKVEACLKSLMKTILRCGSRLH
ncbi:MAG: hypothetical protein II876_11160 [Synergistaceae bacterium]|nr:hypothetical protein [Synergistaceae bacterium]